MCFSMFSCVCLFLSSLSWLVISHGVQGISLWRKGGFLLNVDEWKGLRKERMKIWRGWDQARYSQVENVSSTEHTPSLRWESTQRGTPQKAQTFFKRLKIRNGNLNARKLNFLNVRSIQFKQKSWLSEIMQKIHRLLILVWFGVNWVTVLVTRTEKLLSDVWMSWSLHCSRLRLT